MAGGNAGIVPSNEVEVQTVRQNVSQQPGIVSILFRGVRMRCPQCSNDTLYERWNIFKHHCSSCGFGFEEREGDCWFFLYSTTAALTGLFLIAMFLWKPMNLLLGRIVLMTVAVAVIPLSLPLRKGIALAIEYVSETKGSNLLLYNQDEDQKSSQ